MFAEDSSEMCNKIDCATITAKEYAETLTGWIEQFHHATKLTPAMRIARVAVIDAMRQACELQRNELFSALVTAGLGVIAMEIVAQAGYVPAIEILDAAGVDCNETTSRVGLRPIHCAAMHGQTNAAVKLLELGADPTENALRANALGLAIQYGNLECAKRILDFIGDVHQLKHMRGTIMESVARYGGAELVPILVSRGVSPDKPDINQKPPIAYAVEHGHADVVQALLDAGALRCADLRGRARILF